MDYDHLALFSYIVILFGLQGLFEVVLGILAVTNIPPAGYIFTGSNPLGGELGASLLLIGLTKLLLIWGLWRLQRWAWVVTLLFAGFSGMTSCFAVSQSRFVLWAFVIDLIIPVPRCGCISRDQRLQEGW